VHQDLPVAHEREAHGDGARRQREAQAAARSPHGRLVRRGVGEVALLQDLRGAGPAMRGETLHVTGRGSREERRHLLAVVDPYDAIVERLLAQESEDRPVADPAHDLGIHGQDGLQLIHGPVAERETGQGARGQAHLALRRGAVRDAEDVREPEVECQVSGASIQRERPGGIATRRSVKCNFKQYNAF